MPPQDLELAELPDDVAPPASPRDLRHPLGCWPSPAYRAGSRLLPLDRILVLINNPSRAHPLKKHGVSSDLPLKKPGRTL